MPPPDDDDDDADCRECLSRLRRALDASVGPTRTMSLLSALGVVSHRHDGVIARGGEGGGEGSRVYEPLAGGERPGVLISLRNSDASREALRSRRRMRDAASAAAFASASSGAATVAESSAAAVGGGVLTTSPASSQSSSSHDGDVDAITTIAIECAKCGSDTRAEAGARAFVSGPDNLGIVLCSNRLSSQSEIDEVLVHELVHIYGEW